MADALRSGWITTGPKTKEFEREIALFRTGRALGHVRVGHRSARMRPARFRHRPGRRGDHERLHVHGLLLGHLPCGCDSGALRRGARLLRDGLRRPARSRHRAHARRHPRGHRRTHGRLRPSVRRTRFGERPLEARDGAAERVRSRHRLSRRRPLVRRDISGTSLRVGGRLHRLLVSRREKPDDGRRRRACMARGRVRFRRAVPPVHVAVAARPDEGRAGEEPRGRLGSTTSPSPGGSAT